MKMATLTENVITSDEIDDDFFIIPRVPRGLATAVESLTREIIRQRPKDIYAFAAQHFEKLLRQREYCRPYGGSNDGGKMVITKCNNGNEWSQHKIAEMSMKYNRSENASKMVMPPSSKPKISSVDEHTTICPKIITKSPRGAKKNVQNELRRNFISGSNTRIRSDLNIDEFAGHVIKQFVDVKRLSDLQEIDNVTGVQDIIDNACGPDSNKSLGILHKSDNVKKNTFVAKLDETRNLLEDISSCFSMNHDKNYRPHSADSIANDKRFVTDKLRVMLSDTRDLLVDISASFLNDSFLCGTHAATRNTGRNYVTVSSPSTLPAVQSPLISSIASSTPLSSSLGNKMTRSIEDVDDVKNICCIFALPPVMIDCSVPISSGNLAKTGQDFTLPLLTLPLESRFDRGVVQRIEDIKHSIESTKEEIVVDNDIGHDICENKLVMAEHLVDDNSKLQKNTEILDVDPSCHIFTNRLMKKKVSSDVDGIRDNAMSRTVDVPKRNDAGNNGDPSLESFGEKIITTTTTTSEPLQHVIESLVDDLSSISSIMNSVVKLHHQHVDLHCINEEDDAVIDGYCQGEEFNNVENIALKMCKEIKQDESAVELMNCKDMNIKRYMNEQRDESERSSSAKETSITDEELVLGSAMCIEELTETGNDYTISTEMCESSNEAKETTLTDGVSLSLDDLMRPSVPELNLDSLQDVTVSSFKMTEDDVYEDNTTNSVVETPTSSYQYNQHDEEGLPCRADEIDGNYSAQNIEMSGQSGKINGIHNVLRNHIELEFNRDEVNNTPPCDIVSRSGSRCTTRRVNSGDFTWESEDKLISAVMCDGNNIVIINHEDQDSEEYRDDVSSWSIDAITKIQACVRGFLTRRRYRSKTPVSENHSRATTDSEAVTDLDFRRGEAEILKLFDAATQITGNDFRGYHVGKRLCRENAIIEHATTTSIDDDENLICMNYLGMVDMNNTLRHTGEFHDWIVLPLLDYLAPVNNQEFDGITTMEIYGRTVIPRDEGNCRMQAFIEGTVIEKKDIKNIIECIQLCNDMKWFPRLSIFHFGLNKNMRDDVIDKFVILSNNGTIYVQYEHHNKGLVSLTQSSSNEGVIIQEITDSSSGTLVKIHAKVEHDGHDADGDSSSSSSSSSSSPTCKRCIKASLILDEEVQTIIGEKEDDKE